MADKYRNEEDRPYNSRQNQDQQYNRQEGTSGQSSDNRRDRPAHYIPDHDEYNDPYGNNQAGNQQSRYQKGNEQYRPARFNQENHQQWGGQGQTGQRSSGDTSYGNGNRRQWDNDQGYNEYRQTHGGLHEESYA